MFYLLEIVRLSTFNVYLLFSFHNLRPLNIKTRIYYMPRLPHFETVLQANAEV